MAGNRYSYVFTQTPAADISSVGLTASATVRVWLYEWIVGSSATPADSAYQWVIRRSADTGTRTTAAQACQKLDDDDVAPLASPGHTWTVEPSSSVVSVLRASVNQRATFRWVAAPGSEIVCPAAANATLTVFCDAIGGSAVAHEHTLLHQE